MKKTKNRFFYFRLDTLIPPEIMTETKKNRDTVGLVEADKTAFMTERLLESKRELTDEETVKCLVLRFIDETFSPHRKSC